MISVADALVKLGAPDQALSTGSVFVNGVRAARREQLLGPDDLLEIYTTVPGTQRSRVLEQRDGLLLLEKPAALASEPTRQGNASVAQQLAAELGRRVHLHSRLDVGVSGLLLASTSRAARAHVEALRARGQLGRQYLGIAAAAPAALEGVWNAPVTHHRRARAARTRYRALASIERPVPPRTLTLLMLEPLTGRTHQLRQHCAQHGLPLVGDRRYGGPLCLMATTGSVLAPARILLHAARIMLIDMRGQPWQVSLPSLELEQFWQTSGGDIAAFESA